MAGSPRTAPTMAVAMASPFTVALVAAVALATAALGAPWWTAVLVAAAALACRVVLANALTARTAGRPRRIDPFALREPWRFFVRDALQARARFAEVLDGAPQGPTRDRLAEIGERVTTGVEQCWEVSQRGQELTDARRKIDLSRLRAALDAGYPDDDPRRTSAQIQLDAHDRLAALEHDTREKLEILDARLEESVVRATELTTRAANVAQLEEVADAVDGIVGDLEALRLGLESADGRGQ